MTGITTLFVAHSAGGRPPVSLSNTMTTPDGLWAVGDVVTYSKSTGQTTFPVRNGAHFKVSLYGAAGGNLSNQTGGNSNGGIMIATLNLTAYANTTLYFYRGGGGGGAGGIDGCYDVGTAGYNGGGWGAGSGGPGGGGRTDLRFTTSAYDEILVAGGGGGGRGNQGTGGSRYQGSSGCGGMFGDYCGDNGGGGGGYYGGNASCSDDGQAGGPGSNYILASRQVSIDQNQTFNSTSGGNTGNGYFTIEVISVA